MFSIPSLKVRLPYGTSVPLPTLVLYKTLGSLRLVVLNPLLPLSTGVTYHRSKRESRSFNLPKTLTPGDGNNSEPVETHDTRIRGRG